MQIYAQHNLPLLNYLNNGEVSEFEVLQPGHYGFASVGERLLIVKGMCMKFICML